VERIPEPELMNDPAQACAYAGADFEQPHAMFMERLHLTFPDLPARGHALDLGCGAADITLRFARGYGDWRIDAVDGSPAMLEHGRTALAQAGLQDRVRLTHGVLPEAELPRAGYDAVISNSLLHHLHDPLVLWDAVRTSGRPGAAVFIMDLLRPPSPAHATALVEQYAAGEPEILKRDFFNSLCAAYRVGEVRAQLKRSGLTELAVQAASDRHLIVSGRLP